jgi:DNA-binding MarR family transcriptional regulator
MSVASSPTARTADAVTEPADLPVLPPALADRVGYLLAKAHLGMRAAADEALIPLGLDKKEYAALVLVASEGPLSQQALSVIQGCDRTTMVAVVDRLEDGGLVMRRRNPLDRRAYALEITAKGRRALDQADELVSRVERDFLGPLSAAERRALIDLLQRLIVG